MLTMGTYTVVKLGLQTIIKHLLIPFWPGSTWKQAKADMASPLDMVHFLFIISHYYIEDTFAPTFPSSPSNPELPWEANHW